MAVRGSHVVSSVREMPHKKLFLLLLLLLVFFVPPSISFLKLLDGTTRAYTSAPSAALFFPLSAQQQDLTAGASASYSTSSSCADHINQTANGDNEDEKASPQPGAAASDSVMTEKELALLRSVVSRRAPCNLLVFGLTSQLLSAALLNAAAGGATVFLEDDPERLQVPRPPLESVRIFKVWHRVAAGEAFKVLRRARGDMDCMPSASSTLRGSRCPLALKDLPEEVTGRRWDVVVVDGPRGDRPDAPGRMATIYSAAVMSRWAAGEGIAVDVLVHDVRRTVEKWYAWEYLCDENRVRSKGNLWHFTIRQQSGNSGLTERFCSETKTEIM